MTSSSDSPDAEDRPGHLNGWKEIAAFLGRSVRTVQRWEKDFGLPVRRFGASRPESVFAVAREVDAWLETAQGLTARSGAGAPETAGGSAGQRVEPLFPARWFLHMAVAALVPVAVMTVLWATWARRQLAQPVAPPSAVSSSPAPADWHVDLDILVVSDARGNVLWSHAFTRDLHTEMYRGAAMTPRGVLGGVADVDGDGSREVWFVAHFSGGRSPVTTALYLFEHDGRLRWVYKPSVNVRFGTDTFGPSWILDRAFVTDDPAGGRGRAIWAVMYDAALFPSLLQRLDPRTGNPQSAYWSNGSIVTLAVDLTEGRRRLFVGAANNEHKAGSLAVLDAMDPVGSAPAETEKYRCTSCPPRDPDVFMVFPKAARFGKSDRTAPVIRITPLGDGGVTLGAQHGAAPDGGPAIVIYTLDPAFALRSMDLADDYLKVYQTLAAAGAAPRGAPATVNLDREMLPILRWDGAARRFVEVRRAAAR
jgi:hypothetical protein